MHKTQRPSRLKAKPQLRADLDILESKLRRLLGRHPPNRKMRTAIEAATISRQVTGFLPMSNVNVREAAGLAMIKAQRRSYRRVCSQQGVRTFLVTFSCNEGLIPVNTPDIPLYRIGRKMRFALKQLGLQGICAFDIDVLRRPRGEPSSLLVVHVHAVCWTRDTDFRPRAAEAKLNGLRRFRNRLGVPSFTIRSRAESAARHNFGQSRPGQDQTAASMAYLGYYLTKPCIIMKKRFKRGDGSHTVRADKKRFGCKAALRLASIWANISPFEAVFAVGREGNQVAKDYKHGVRKWAKSVRGTSSSAQEISTAVKHYVSRSALDVVPARVKKRPSHQ